ncbi:helix-turn-helix domain-containing protein [Indiicoccus explosivorum]|uniref:helix-turn-helix domain-containing protein n=1 Tax=Indiicoccus explosivorum TaxID=1917864 RepID=UPI000B452659|nr:helix-turn-helix transcriptional regulator [Indiicoccus explosivorum]
MEVHITKEKLYRIRRVHALTVAQMGALLGVTDGYVSQMETGYAPITRRMERKIIEAFNLTPNTMRGITLYYNRFIRDYGDKERVKK